MSQMLKFLVMGSVVFTASCDRVSPPARPAKPVSVPVPSFLAGLPPVKDEPIPEPKFVDFETLNFRTPQVRSTVLKWEELLKKYKRPEDVHVAWNKLTPITKFSPVSQRYCEFWTNVPHLINPEKSYPESYLAANEIRLLRIECVLRENQEDQKVFPDHAWMKAVHFSRDGWKVEFAHEESSRSEVVRSKLEFEVMAFHYRGTSLPRKGVLFDFLPGQFAWHHLSSFDGRSYYFSIALPEVAAQPKAKKFAKIKPRLRALSASADSFRQTCHDVANELERHMKERFSPAKAVLESTTHNDVECLSYETIADDTRERLNNPSKKLLMAEDWQSVLNAGLAEIAKRRKMVDDHYVEMHGALVGLLPVHEFYMNED